MQGRGLFLGMGPLEQIKNFLIGSNITFEDSWLFCRSRNKLLNYFLANFFMEKPSLTFPRLIFGEKYSLGERIRFLLSTGTPSAHFILPQKEDNYVLVENLFLRSFNQYLNISTRKA